MFLKKTKIYKTSFMWGQIHQFKNKRGYIEFFICELIDYEHKKWT